MNLISDQAVRFWFWFRFDITFTKHWVPYLKPTVWLLSSNCYRTCLFV